MFSNTKENTVWGKCPKQLWITPALIKSCDKKSKLYKNYLMNPSATIKTKFCT